MKRQAMRWHIHLLASRFWVWFWVCMLSPFFPPFINMHIRLIENSKLSVSAQPVFLPLTHWLLGQISALPMTLIRNKRLLRDLFPDSLHVSSQVHIEIHWNVIGAFGGKIRLYATAHRCGARGHVILQSTVTTPLAVVWPMSHDPGAFVRGESGSNIYTECAWYSSEVCTWEDSVQWMRHTP